MKIQKYVMIYFSIILVYTLLYGFKNWGSLVLLDSSSLGDFLSGLFAPLAFLYLLLGYKQQEKALNQTNQDILEQLKIQEKMLELQLKDQKAKEHAAQPIIDFYVTTDNLPYDKETINTDTGRPLEAFKRRFNFIITNSGEKVSQVNIRCVKPFYKSIAFNRTLNTSQKLNSYLYLNEDQLNEYTIDGDLDLKVEIEYRTNLGLKYKLKYEVNTYENNNPSDPSIIYSAISTPILID